MSRSIKKHRASGSAMLYALPMMVVMCGLVSFAVDYGRVQLAKTELQSAADAAARAAAAGLSTSAAQARSNAIAIAGANKADGSSIVLTTADIDVGNWSNNTFTLNGSPSNAVRVRTSRTAAKGNAVPLLFGRIAGRSTCDVNTTAIALATNGDPSGFIGLDGITLKNNAYFGGYSSATTTTPNHASATSTCYLGSNGAIDGKNNNDLYGNALLGPSGSISGISVHGTTTTQSTNISKPTSPAWSPTANPGGVAQNYTVSSNTTLAGGTYWFTSLNINANLTFSGPTTVYVNGDVDINATLKPSSQIPSDLKIHQIGNHTFGDSKSNNVTIYGVLSGPDSEFVFKNNFTIYGSALFDTIEFKNNADCYFDTTSAVNGGAGGVSIAIKQ